MNKISKALREHYAEKFADYGATPEGVDWGSDVQKMLLRYDKMLDVIQKPLAYKPTLLDVGCGFGGLCSYTIKNNIEIDYTGIDIVENMIEWAVKNVSDGEFLLGDILHEEFPRKYDYVICNGILTQKLDTPGLKMDEFAGELIRKLFSICKVGVAFNVMTTKVNFYSNNLYYRNPAELLAWCMSEISTKIRIDHAYPLFEYTVYLYREDSI